LIIFSPRPKNLKISHGKLLERVSNALAMSKATTVLYIYMHLAITEYFNHIDETLLCRRAFSVYNKFQCSSKALETDLYKVEGRLKGGQCLINWVTFLGKCDRSRSKIGNKPTSIVIMVGVD
jgi:hypothetical protein